MCVSGIICIFADEIKLNPLIQSIMQKQNDKKKGDVMINEKYIRFDWAVKRMLRDKANFDVLEGPDYRSFGREDHD